MLAHKVQAVVAEVADADVEVPAEEDRAGVDPAEVDSVIVVEVEGAAVVEAEAEEVEVEVEGEEEEEEVSQNLHSICFYNASIAAKEDSLRAVGRICSAAPRYIYLPNTCTSQYRACEVLMDGDLHLPCSDMCCHCSQHPMS